MAHFRDYNKYGVGNVRYPGGSPNGGMQLDPLGYAERDNKAKARTNALLRMIKAKQKGRYMSTDFLGRNAVKGTARNVKGNA